MSSPEDTHDRFQKRTPPQHAQPKKPVGPPGFILDQSPVIEVELPDGQIIEVETDDPDVAASAARKYLHLAKRAANAPATPPGEPPIVPGAGVATPEAPSLLEDAGRKLKLGFQGVGRGVADFIGAPTDLMTGALNAAAWTGEAITNRLPGVGNADFGRIRAPVGGSANIADLASIAANAAGVPAIPETEMSSGERLAYSANRASVNALASGAALRAAATALPAQRSAGVADMVLDPYRTGSVRPHVGDVAGGMGAGSAVEFGRAHLPENMQGPLADTVLSIIGGGGGAALAAAARSPRAAVNAITDLLPDPNMPRMGDGVTVPVSRGATQRAAQYVQSNATNSPPVSARNIEERTQWFRDRGLPVPTSGALSGDIGLTAIEQGDRVRNPVPYQVADQTVRTAAASELRSVAPEGAIPRAATEMAARDAKALTTAADEAVRSAEARSLSDLAAEQAIAAPYREPGNAGAASRALDAVVVEKTMYPRMTAKNERFAAIPDVPRNAQPLKEIAAKVRQSVGSLNDPNAVLPQGTLQRIEALGDTVNFQDVNKLRPELAAAITVARKAGNIALADNIRALKLQAGKEAARMASEGNPEASEALRYFAEDFAPYFGEGTRGGQLRRDINSDVNRVATAPSSTAERFLHTASDSKEAAADLRRILSIAPDPAAGEKAVRAYVLSDLYRTVDPQTLAISPLRLKDWMARRADMLSEFPAIQKEMQTLARDVVNGRAKSNATAGELQRAMKAADLTRREIEHGSMALLLDSSPDVAVARVFAANDREKAMREVVKTLSKDPAAAAGWKKAVSEYLENKLTGTNTQLTDTGDAPVQFATTQRFLRENRDVLAAIYSPQEMNALQKAQKLLEPFGALARRATTGSPTAERNAQTWNALEAGLKAYYGVLKGGGVLRTMKIAVSALPNSDAQVGWLVHRMQLDPELAVHLLNTPLRDVGSVGWNKNLNRLLGVEAGSRASGEPEQERR